MAEWQVLLLILFLVFLRRCETKRQQKDYLMGKLAEVAKRIKETKAKLEKEADALALELDAVDKSAPEAFEMGHAMVNQQKADVEEMKADLRQLSNLPLASS